MHLVFIQKMYSFGGKEIGERRNCNRIFCISLFPMVIPQESTRTEGAAPHKELFTGFRLPG